MAVAVESSGTQTATIGTEHSLAAPTSAGVRQLVVDLVNLVNGETVELRVKRPALSGGAIGTWQTAVYTHAQPEPIVISVPMPSAVGGTFTLKQTVGTGRNFPWAVETL